MQSEKDYSIVRFFNADFVYFKDYVTFDYTGYDEVEAIPITSELLLKLGAIKINENSFNLKNLQVNYTDGIWYDYLFCIELLGLHHLQNVYYFRNNEELNTENL